MIHHLKSVTALLTVVFLLEQLVVLSWANTTCQALAPSSVFKPKRVVNHAKGKQLEDILRQFNDPKGKATGLMPIGTIVTIASEEPGIAFPILLDAITGERYPVVRDRYEKEVKRAMQQAIKNLDKALDSNPAMKLSADDWQGLLPLLEETSLHESYPLNIQDCSRLVHKVLLHDPELLPQFFVALQTCSEKAHPFMIYALGEGNPANPLIKLEPDQFDALLEQLALRPRVPSSFEHLLDYDYAIGNALAGNPALLAHFFSKTQFTSNNIFIFSKAISNALRFNPTLQFKADQIEILVGWILQHPHSMYLNSMYLTEIITQVLNNQRDIQINEEQLAKLAELWKPHAIGNFSVETVLVAALCNEPEAKDPESFGRMIEAIQNPGKIPRELRISAVLRVLSADPSLKVHSDQLDGLIDVLKPKPKVPRLSFPSDRRVCNIIRLAFVHDSQLRLTDIQFQGLLESLDRSIPRPFGLDRAIAAAMLNDPDLYSRMRRSPSVDAGVMNIVSQAYSDVVGPALAREPGQLLRFHEFLKDVGLTSIDLNDAGDSFNSAARFAENFLSNLGGVTLKQPPADFPSASSELSESDVGKMANLDSILQGCTFLRAQGRTLLYQTSDGKILALKLLREGENRRLLAYENELFDYMNMHHAELGLQAKYPRGCPMDGKRIVRVAELPSQALDALRQESDKQGVALSLATTATRGAYTLTAYIVSALKVWSFPPQIRQGNVLYPVQLQGKS